MMAPVIRIDEDVEQVLKEKAVEMDLVFGTPNQVLRKVLGIELSENSVPRALERTQPNGHRRSSTFVTGKKLAESHGMSEDVAQAFYRETGDWYRTPTEFPVALFGREGYVVVDSLQALEINPTYQIGETLHVPNGVEEAPGYVFCAHTH
jgi:hypothetical protein